MMFNHFVKITPFLFALFLGASAFAQTPSSSVVPTPTPDPAIVAAEAAATAEAKAEAEAELASEKLIYNPGQKYTQADLMNFALSSSSQRNSKYYFFFLIKIFRMNSISVRPILLRPIMGAYWLGLVIKLSIRSMFYALEKILMLLFGLFLEAARNV